mgnify:CR=1 FL=1
MKKLLLLFLCLLGIGLSEDFSDGPYGTGYFDIAGPFQLPDLNMSLNGDVNLSDMSVIFGDITYKKPDSKWFDSDDKPTLTIDKTVKIHGSIILNRPVSLVFENPAHHQKVVESYHVEQ